jgi:hypothetical protein
MIAPVFVALCQMRSCHFVVSKDEHTGHFRRRLFLSIIDRLFQSIRDIPTTSKSRRARELTMSDYPIDRRLKV